MPGRLLILILTVLTAAAAADPHAVRRWTGKNGKSFDGAYLGIDKASGKYQFVLDGGRSHLVDPANLSAEDLAWLEGELHPETKAPAKDGDWTHFLPDPEFDRRNIPVINQSDYGSKASDCVPSSFCNFVLWWDQRDYLPIDKRGDFDRKAEYIHTRMARYFGTRNNAGTSMEDAGEGIREYFEKDLAELATFRIITDQDCSPENLRRYTRGPWATLLEVSTFYGREDEGGHVTALAEIDAAGDLIILTWGTRIRGRLKILQKDVRFPDPTNSLTAHKYEIEFMNRADLPEWMIENEVRFEIDPDRHDGLTVIIPYRYKEAGKPFPPPPNPLIQPPPSRQPGAQ